MKRLIIILSVLSLFLVSGCSTIALGGRYDSSGTLITNTTIYNDPLNPIITQEFLYEIATGNVEGAYMIHKFGANDDVGTTIEPITISGFYRTPTSATSLEIVSSSIEDSALGTGARKIKVIGINGSGEEIWEDVIMNGTNAVPLVNDYLRVFRYYVIESGSYATQTTPSQVGVIDIQELGGGNLWSRLNLVDGGFGVGQSEIGVYTIPKGYNCWLLKKVISVDSVKSANIYFFQRQNITNNVAPYDAMRLVEKHIGVTGVEEINSRSAITKFPELTDVGFMAETSTGTASISVEFELVCLDNVLYS